MTEVRVPRIPETVEIGPERQLFVDDHVIDMLEKVARFVHQPAKYEGNPVVAVEKPWEQGLLVPMSLLCDEDEKLFKYWYAVRTRDSDDRAWCYALSEDGIRFERPELGLVEFEGSTANNLIALKGPQGAVMKDFRDEDPQRRYKMTFFVHTGVGVAFSPDGLQWTEYEDNPVLRPAGDGQTAAFWDERYDRYVYYGRPNGRHVKRTSALHDASAYPSRRAGRAESADFLHWTDIEEIIAPDERDGKGTDFYYMHVLRYAGCYLGLLTVYHEYTDDPDPDAGFNNTLDLQLAFSRDGIKWSRVGERQVFLRGTPGSWDEKRVYGEKALVWDDEIRIYYRGSNMPHGGITERVGTEVDGRQLVGDYLGLARLRLDGFVSLDAGAEEGVVVTRPLRFEGGSALQVNADAAQGSLEMEVVTLYGKPIEGFTRDACRTITTDDLRHQVKWDSGKTLAAVEQPVRLRFSMRQTRLYSFAVVP